MKLMIRVWAENERNAKLIAAELLPVEEVWEGRSWSRWNNPLPNMIPDNPDRIAARDYE